MKPTYIPYRSIQYLPSLLYPKPKHTICLISGDLIKNLKSHRRSSWTHCLKHLQYMWHYESSGWSACDDFTGIWSSACMYIMCLSPVQNYRHSYDQVSDDRGDRCERCLATFLSDPIAWRCCHTGHCQDLPRISQLSPDCFQTPLLLLPVEKVSKKLAFFKLPEHNETNQPIWRATWASKAFFEMGRTTATTKGPSALQQEMQTPTSIGISPACTNPGCHNIAWARTFLFLIFHLIFIHIRQTPFTLNNFSWRASISFTLQTQNYSCHKANPEIGWNQPTYHTNPYSTYHPYCTPNQNTQFVW